MRHSGTNILLHFISGPFTHSTTYYIKNFARRVRSFEYLDIESDSGVDWILGVVPIFLQLWNGTRKISDESWSISHK